MNEALSLLNELKFIGMKETLDYRISEAIQNNLAHTDFLALLLEDEQSYRRNRKSEMLRKRAKFNIYASLDEFQGSSKRGITKAAVKQFKTMNFHRSKENLIFIGGTGAGKSFLAQAIGHEACSQCIETIFISVNRLFKEIEVAEASGTYLNYIGKLGRSKILILDDFGLRNYSHEEANILYDILEERYQKGSTIITSQVKPQGWKVLFEDEVIAEAIIDRITACAHTIDVTGDSFRSNHAPKKDVRNIES
ncbi:MAG: DNA replication protein DnaC [Bacteriovoracaceae bacterium]|jgi:DNA replication protein DnaC